MEVRLTVSGKYESITTHNVVAETVAGDDTSVIVVGAHLDGVEAGPGINDNGSGSSVILEVARAFSALYM